MKILLSSFLTISLMFLSGCEALKYKKVSAKDFPADPRQRTQKNMEEGRGFRLMDGINNNNGYSFASSNPLWRATLDTLDFMPLVSANYSGGIVITDWYSDISSPNESIKITVRFLSDEIRSDALDINIFIKECAANLSDCSVNQSDNDLVSELSLNILRKATLYEREKIEKNKKENPYVLSTPGDTNSKKKNTN